MGMRLLLIAFFIVTWASNTNAVADDSAATAADLEQLCSATDSGSKNACRFYILGVSQGIQLGLGIADGLVVGGQRPCIPPNISSATLELTVKKMLGADLMVYPDDRKLDASGVIGAILTHSFPCGKR
jgi:Rap1a immunity proteins